MRFLRIVAVVCFVPMAVAQLTSAQKTADFMQLAGLYAKNYAPYEIKLNLFNFDLYNLQPWLDQINNSQNDVQFYDILTRYVASLQDSHDEFITPTDFEAWLHLDLDIYDGKVLIGDIDRSYLSTRKYPFQVGDELVSVDGAAAMDALNALIPYSVNGSGNKTSQMRLAAGAIADRLQAWNPTAAQVGENTTLVIKRQGSGNLETYTIPWDKTGTALTMAGPVPTAQSRAAQNKRGLNFATRYRRGVQKRNPWGIYSGPPVAMDPDAVPDYMQAIKKLTYGRAMVANTASAGLFPFDNPYPLFDPPMGFKLHLGAASTDQFISGTFPVSGHTIGYIRIYTMAPPSESVAFTQFANEMVYMQKNSDGLIVDVMGNGGGDGCYSQVLAQAVIPTTFRGLAGAVRATSGWVQAFSAGLTAAKQEGAPQWVIDLYTQYLAYVQQANSENRGLTGSLPFCSASFDTPPLANSKGQVTAYSKPLLVLTDNYTLSAGEIFVMFLQDSQRATVMGTRTDGGGGNVAEFDYNATDYSEGTARVTESLVTRSAPVATPGFPLSPFSIFYDGMGIYPDITLDYQTLDNLLNGGQTFVNTAAAQMVKMIEQSSTVVATGPAPN